jgi:hypothetical protein
MSDLSSEWLKKIFDILGSIRSVLVVMGVLVGGIVLTLFLQHRRLTASLQAQKETATASWSEWNGLQSVYEEFPDNYLQDDVTPWYQLSYRLTILTTFIEDGNPKELEASKDPKSQTMARVVEVGKSLGVKKGDSKRISACFQAMKGYNADLRNIEWDHDAKIPFENLSRSKLESLVNTYSFLPDKNALEGCTLARNIAIGFFKTRLDQVKNAQGAQVFDDRFDDILKVAPNLKDFGTLKATLLVKDLGTFQEINIDAPTQTKLLSFLQNTPFSSLQELRQENLRLAKEIESLQKNDEETSIKLPFVDTPVTLSDFSDLSTVLNTAILLWILLLIVQYRHAVAQYLRAGGDQAIVRQVLTLVPLAKPFSWMILPLATVYLVLPSLLGTGLLILCNRKTSIAVISVTNLFIAMTVLLCFLALFIVFNARRCGLLSERHPANET